MDEDIGLQHAIYSSLTRQVVHQRLRAIRVVENHSFPLNTPRNGKRNALLREGIMPAIPRSAQSKSVVAMTFSQYRQMPAQTEWTNAVGEDVAPENLPVHLQQPSDRVPGWTQMCSGGRVQRQNTLGSHLVLISAEAHNEQAVKVHCSDLLLLRAVAPLPQGQGASCFTVQVQNLATPGRYAMFGMGVTPTPGAELRGFPLVLVHFDASGGVFLSVEQWRLTEQESFERLSVLEPMRQLRMIRDRVTLLLVITSACISLSINGEVVFPVIDAPGVHLGESLPILLATGGKVSLRDLAVAEGDKPPANRIYGRAPNSGLSPKKNDVARRGQVTSEDERCQSMRGSPFRDGYFSSMARDKRPERRKKPLREAKGGVAANNLPAGINPEFAERIESEIIDHSPNVEWDSIAGIPEAKRLLKEAVILPLLVPELFTGVVQPWKGVLLFGPPGTGKTMLARAVATTAKTTFFNISASTLISRYFGESEKMVRTLFQLARHYAPSTVFFDEVDALISSRGGNEHEASRRVKSELLQQIDGINTEGEKRVMVLATTNRPWDLDDAMRRRLEKRIYIPLPNEEGRLTLLKKQTTSMSLDPNVDLEEIAINQTKGFSGADMNLLVRDAAMMPMRRLIEDRTPEEIAEMKKGGQMVLSAVTMQDFEVSVKKIQPSVSQSSIRQFEKWAEELGSV